MLTRRAALLAGAGLVASPLLVRTAAPNEEAMDTTGAAVDLSNLRRIRRELVPPPGAHEHEQVAPAGPRIVGFEMTRRGAQPLELVRRLRGRGAPP